MLTAWMIGFSSCKGEKWRLQRCALKPNVYCMDWNKPLNVGTLSVLVGAGPNLCRPTASLDWHLILQNVGERRRVFSLQYMYRITLQNVLLSNKDLYSFSHPQYCSYVTCNCLCNFDCLWTLWPCVLKKTKSQRIFPHAPLYFPIKHIHVNSLYNTSPLL